MPRPIGYDILCLITAVLGLLVALASAVNITHARDSNPDSPEPNTWANILSRGFVGLCGAIAALVGLIMITRHVDYLDPLGIGFWLIGVAMLGWINVEAWSKALLSFRILRQRAQRRELQADARRRYPYSLSALAAICLLLGGIGCSINPDTGKAQLDLTAIPANIHLLTDLVEQTAYVVLPPGKQQDELVNRAEQARKATDTPALKALLAQLQQTPNAKALVPSAK